MAKRTRAERIAQRRNIILRDAGITKKTQERYFWALSLLLPFLEHVHSTLELDERTCDWIQSSWDAGDALHIVSDGLCGLHHFEPWTKRLLPMAWKLFGIWKKLESPDRAPPLTFDIVYAWTNYALAHNQLIFAALLCLGFFGLLRTGELLQVCAKDILVGDRQAIISLPNTKTGQREKVQEMVMIDDFLSLEVLRTLKTLQLKLNMANTPLWVHSAEAFRNQFKRYCTRFDLLPHKFRPYSLRRGGATWVFRCSGSMETALVKGRWGSHRVARIYIADALSYLPGLTFSQKAKNMLNTWSPF